MPFFLIAPVCLLCILIGLTLLLSKKMRFLGSDVILASLVGTFASFLLSTGVLVVAPRLVSKTFVSAHRWLGVATIVAYVLAIFIGGAMGVLVGCLTARKINRSLGW
jgi:hypothetical protein